MARKTGPVRPESEPTLAQPGDVYESSFDGAGLSLYPASAFQEASDTPLDPRVYESVADFATRGLFLPVMFDEDNGCFVRFRLGDAEPAEEAEWVGRVVWKLDLRCGQLGVNGETVIRVPPAEYRVEVGLYVPSTSAFRLLDEMDRRKEPLWDYWTRTHPGELLPGWLVELVTSQDEDVVDPSLLPKGERTDEFAGVRVKVNGKWRELPRPSPVEYADVVVRLSPIEADLALPDLSRNGFRRGTKPKGRVLKERGTPWFLVWESRKPLVCPTGLERRPPSARPASGRTKRTH